MGDGTRIGDAPGALTGRDDDLEYITAFVDQAAVSGGALLLSGEAGVGKTVLLDAAAAHAEIAGSRVLRAAGAEFEGAVSFAGLNQLLGPLGAVVTGGLRDVPRLLDDARKADAEQVGSLVAAVAAAHHLLLSGDGDIDTAHRLLVGAIEMQPEPYDAASDTMVEALYTLGWVCYFGGRAELWVPFHRALAQLIPDVPEVLALLSATFADPARTALPVLGRIDAAVAALTEQAELGLGYPGRSGLQVHRPADRLPRRVVADLAGRTRRRPRDYLVPPRTVAAGPGLLHDR